MKAAARDLPAHHRDVIPTGWQFTMWPYMQEYWDGTQREMGTHYALSTIHEGRKIGYGILIGNPLKRQPWFPEYECERIATMVAAIRTEIASKVGVT